MRKLAKDIWIFDGEAVPFLFLPFTTRMTVIRLASGKLWVHSPIKLTDKIQSQVDQLGAVEYIISPNHLHHLFLADWQNNYPEAVTYGTAEVIKKRSDLTFDYSLNEIHSWPWRDDIDQLLFTGSPLMEECIFFHKLTGTLIVTDLIENFSGKDFNYLQLLVAKGAGIVAPNGKMPIDWRLSFLFGKPDARKHFSSIINWQPKVIVMSHGEVIESSAPEFLKRAFSWLA